MLDKILQKLGLSSKEARVYLAALELGAAPVQQIAKKATVNRPTTYVILESLMKKGLATSVERGKKVLFTAEPPEQLERLLARQQDEIEEKRQDLLKILPELEAIFNLSENRPRVKFYEGKEGIIAAGQDFLNNIEPRIIIYSFTPLDEILRVFPEFDKINPKERMERRLPTRVIYTNFSGRLKDADSRKEMRETRFIPKDKFPFYTALSIVPNMKINLTTYKDRLLAVNIDSPEIANSLKAIWDLAWEAAEKYNTTVSSRTK